MPSQRTHSRVLPLVVATACWGAGTVVTKQVLDDVAPLTLLPLQLAASCLILAVALRLRRMTISWSPQMTRLTLLGLLNPGLAYALGLLGLASISASMSVLLWAAEPVLIVLLAAAVLREHTAGTLAAGLGVALVGVLLVVYQPGASGDLVGIALTLAAVTCCALYTVLTRRLLVDDASLAVVLIQQAAALSFALVLVTLSPLAGGPGWEVAGLPGSAWLGAIASGGLYYALAFWFYLAGLRHVSASVAGSFLTLIPVFGVAAGYIVGERLSGTQWLGAGLVIAGTVAVALRQRSPAMQAEG